MFVSYAQNGEDIVLWRILRDVTRGTYVDVGAADPTAGSVTRAFYDRGWSGINIEPVPSLAQRLELERPHDRTFRCAAGDRSESVAFYSADETGLSTLDPSLVQSIRERGYEVEQIPVTMRTLNDILDEVGLENAPIHFIKVDVEGAEAQVLAGLDLARWRPWVLVVEATEPMSVTQNHLEWEQSVTDNGYTFCLFDGLNRFYVADEHPELVPLASYPVCTFDAPYRSEEYERNTDSDRQAAEAAVIRLTDQTVELERQIEARERHGQDLTARLDELSTNADGAVRRSEELATALEAVSVAALSWRSDALRRRGEVLTANDVARQANEASSHLAIHAAQLDQTSGARQREIDAMLNTLSWRVTRPLRAVRRLHRRDRPSSDAVESGVSRETQKQKPTGPDALDDSFVRRFCERVAVVAALLDPAYLPRSVSLEEAIPSFERIVDKADVSVMTKAWLGMVSVVGSYPDESSLELAARTYRSHGGHGLSELMLNTLERLSHDVAGVESDLEVVRGGVLVDVSHTAAHDLHTGIQRVVREVSSRWLIDPNVRVVQWNFSTGSLKLLAEDEADRLRNWRKYLHDSGSEVKVRSLKELTGKTLIPWESVVVLPELVANPPACSGLRALAQSGVAARTSLIGYDTVPMTAAETVTHGMTANFGHYLSLVKHSTHLAAISESAASEFHAFAQMLRSQGLPGPNVTARPLPTETPDISAADIETARREFDAGLLPVVVVVGSHEPRKNHLAVLEASESLWRSGRKFDLIFAGVSSWGGSMFGEYLQQLAAEGFPVRVYERVGEKSLWALYSLAEFSVFPSLLEGYGLPVAESLGSGTPVITSNHGSMAEIGKDGGVVLVDPRNTAELASAMSSLLVDKELRDRLAGEARGRVFPTWAQYAESLWTDLVGPHF